MNVDDEAQKRLIKEALKEWLDEKFTTLGKWTAGGFAAASLAALVILILWTSGWHK